MSATPRPPPAPEHKLRASKAAGKYGLHRPGTAGAKRSADDTTAAAVSAASETASSLVSPPPLPHARVEYIGGFLKRRFQRSTQAAAEERDRLLFGRSNAAAAAAVPAPGSTALAIATPASPYATRPMSSSSARSGRSDSPGPPPSFSRAVSVSSVSAANSMQQPQRRISVQQQKRESILLSSEDPWEGVSRYARAASITAPLPAANEPLSSRTHIPPNAPLVLVPVEPPRLRERAKATGALTARRIVEQRRIAAECGPLACGSKPAEEHKEEHSVRSSASPRHIHSSYTHGFDPEAAAASYRSAHSEDSGSDSDEDELLEAHAAEAAMNARRSASPLRASSPSRLSPRVPPPSTLAAAAELVAAERERAAEQRSAHIRKLSITIAQSPVLQPQQTSAPVWPAGSPGLTAASAASPRSSSPHQPAATATGRLTPSAVASSSSAPVSAATRPPHARRPSVLGSVLEHSAAMIPPDTQHRSLPSSPCAETPATSAIVAGESSPVRELRASPPPTPILKSALSPFMTVGGGGAGGRTRGLSESLSPPASVASPHARGRSVSFSQPETSGLAMLGASMPLPPPLPLSLPSTPVAGSAALADAAGPPSPAAAAGLSSPTTPSSAFSSPRLAVGAGTASAVGSPAVTALQSPTLFRRGSIEQVRRLIAGHIKTGIKPHSRSHSRSHSPYLSPRTIATGDPASGSGEASGTSSPARSPSPLKLHPSSRQGSPQRRPMSEGSRASFLSLDALSSPLAAGASPSALPPEVAADPSSVSSELEELAAPTTFVTADLPSHPLALQIAMLVSATSRRSSLGRVQKEDQARFITELTQAQQQQQQQQQQPTGVVGRATTPTIGALSAASLSPRLSPRLSPQAMSHSRSKSAYSPPSVPHAHAPVQLSSRARGGSTTRAQHLNEEESKSDPAVEFAASPIEAASSRRSSQRMSATRPLAQSLAHPLPQHHGGRGRGVSVPQLQLPVDDLPGAADPRDLSFVPALGLTKPLAATLNAQKLFDGRFVQPVPLVVPVARPVSAVAASRSAAAAGDAVSVAYSRLRQASMEIMLTSAAARTLVQLTEETKLEREKEAAAAAVAAAATAQEEALLKQEVDALALVDQSNPADAQDDPWMDPLAARARSVSRPETPSAFVVPSTPHGLPRLTLPLMPPSSFAAFAEKWGAAREDGGGEAAAPSPWTLPAGETTRRQQQRHAELQRAREIEGEDAEQRPLWPPEAHVLRSELLSTDSSSNVFTLKMAAIEAAEAAARAAEEKRKQGLSADEIAALTHVHVSQSEASILAPLASASHNRRASDVPSEFSEVSVSDEVRVAVAQAQDFARERLRLEVEEQAAARARERASLVLRAPSPSDQEPAAATPAAQTLNSFDLVSFRGARSFASELRTLEDQRQEVRLDADDSEEDDEAASGKRATAELFKPAPTWIDPSLPSTIAAVIAGGRTGLVRNLPGSAAVGGKVARKSVSFGSSRPTSAAASDVASPLATAVGFSNQPAPSLPPALDVVDESAAAIEAPPSSSPTVLYRSMEQRQQDSHSPRRGSSSKRSSKQSSRASSRPQSARVHTPAPAPPAAAPAVPVLKLHEVPAHLYPPSMYKESAAQQSARMDLARRFFEDDSEAVEAERAVLEAPHEALNEDALARLLGNGFQPFDPATQMVIDGRIMQRPFAAHWLSAGEQVAARMRRDSNSIEFAARSTNKNQARTMASRDKIERMARRPDSARTIKTGKTRIDSPVPIEDDDADEEEQVSAAQSKRTAAAGGVAAGFASPLHAMLYFTSRKSPRDLARLLRPGSEVLPLSAAQRAQLQARLTQEEEARMDRFRRGEITALELEQQEAAAAREARRLRSKQPSPAASVWVGAGASSHGSSHHKAARFSAATRAVPSRPQTARRPVPVAAAATAATMMPSRPLSARPASAASTHSGAGGGRTGAAIAAASLAHASRNLNDFVLRDSVQALLQDEGDSRASSRAPSRAQSRPQSASASARRSRLLRPSSAATAQPVAVATSFIQPSAISSRLTASVVSALVHERPRSAAHTTLLDYALPVSDLRAEEQQREVDEASRLRHHLQTNHLAIELAEQAARRARREERRIEAQRKQEALLETLVQEGNELDAEGKPKSLLRQSSGSKRALLAALTGSRKALHEVQQSAIVAANAGQAGTRGRRLTAMQRRVEIEKEFLLFAARPVDPRFSQLRAAKVARAAAAAAAAAAPTPSAPAIVVADQAEPEVDVTAASVVSSSSVPTIPPFAELAVEPSAPAAASSDALLLPSSSPTLSIDVSSADPASSIATFAVVSAEAAPAAATLQRRGSMVEQFGAGAVLVSPARSRRATMEEQAVVAAAEAVAQQQALIAEEQSAASSCFVLLDAADHDAPGSSTSGGPVGSDFSADQGRLDELLVAEIEASPIWVQAVSSMLQEESGYELPRELDRRIIALIAAGEHELTAAGSPPHLRPYLLDGVRCLRELASRRLESLYADDELMSMAMDDATALALDDDSTFGL